MFWQISCLQIDISSLKSACSIQSALSPEPPFTESDGGLAKPHMIMRLNRRAAFQNA